MIPTSTSWAPAPGTVPPGHRLYAVGDIHGRADLLDAVINKVVEDSAEIPEMRKALIFLGDYIDRGPESSTVVDMMLEADPKGIEVINLMGNHEQFLLMFLRNSDIGAGWLQNGGMETFESYGIELDGRDWDIFDYDQLQAELEAVLPLSHIRFFEKLRVKYQEGDYFFTHAGVSPASDINKQKAQDLLWIREPFLSSEKDHGAIVVHGHSPGLKPVIKPNRIGIDTAAYYTGHLTCLVLEGDQMRFL